MSNQVIHADIGQDRGVGSLSKITFDQASEIPLDVKQYMPNPSLSIPLLLTYSFPLVFDLNDRGLRSASDCLTDLEPSWNIGTLLMALIPHRKWVSDIGIELGKRWGSQKAVLSVQHPGIPDLRLPVWGVAYWEGMTSALKERRRWKSALDWVLKREDCPERVAVLDTIGSTPWGFKMTTIDSDALIGSISDLLSNGWLRETHMRNMAAVFNKACTSGWYASGPILAETIKETLQSGDEQIKANEVLNKVLDGVATAKATHIVFTVNLNKNHWIAAHIDITKAKYTYGAFLHPSWSLCLLVSVHCTGDSLGYDRQGELADLYTGMRKWLGLKFGRKFSSSGRKFTIGLQQDGSSCGLCALNAMDHAMLQATLFEHSMRDRIRMDYLVRMVRYVLSEVGTPSTIFTRSR
jgi:hypothetical protein